MTILIASSFGALGEFVVAVPALLAALVVSVLAAVFRLRWLFLVAGLACLLTAAWLFSRDRDWRAAYERYPKPSRYADEAQQARSELRFLGNCAFGLGLLASAGILLPHRDRRPHGNARSDVD